MMDDPEEESGEKVEIVLTFDKDLWQQAVLREIAAAGEAGIEFEIACHRAFDKIYAEHGIFSGG